MDRTFTQRKISTKKSDNNLNQQPSEEIINTILNYSRSLEVKKSNVINCIEVVLN